MKLNLFQLCEKSAQQAIVHFSGLPFVKTAVEYNYTDLLMDELNKLGDFYLNFFQQIDLLPKDMSYLKRQLVGTYDFYHELACSDPIIKNTLESLPHKANFSFGNIVPIHARIATQCCLYLTSGIAWTNNRSEICIVTTEFSFPKNEIVIPPHYLYYLNGVLEEYASSPKQKLRGMISRKGINYRQFQEDCRNFWNDTFHSFYIKSKMRAALLDIVFTVLSLKEIAYKNKFTDYANMHKNFAKSGLVVKMIPRLAYF